MAALAKGVQRPECPGVIRSAPQLDNTVVFQGGMVMIDTSGRAAPAAAGSAGAFVGGIALPNVDLDRYDNTVVGHADGFLTVKYQEGHYPLINDGTNPILSTTQPGTILFAVDDQTVSLSSNGGARPIAGRLVKLDTTLTGGTVVVDIGLSQNKQLTESPGAINMLTSVGHNGAGACTLTGAKVGDKVLNVSNVTDHVTAASSFETFITVADQIQQTAVGDLSLKTIIVLLESH